MPPTTPTAPLFVAATFRGTVSGWQPAGPARPAADAERLAALLQRIRPDYISKIRPA